MNINLIQAKQKSAKVFAELDDLRARQKTRIEDLNRPENRKKYAPEFLKSEVEKTKAEFVTAANLHKADLEKIEASLALARGSWDTSTLMSRARLTHDESSETAQILAELRKMNMTNEARDSTSVELQETIAQAAKAGDLFALEVARRETNRREFPDSVTRMQTLAALAEAMKAVVIPGQSAALEAIAQASLTVESAQDLISEIETGKEPPRAAARRIGLAAAQKPGE
jgi:hypothetical protein